MVHIHTDHMQTGYAADLLYIATLCFSKISVALLLRTISPVQLHKQMTLAVGAVTILWAVVAIFGLAFQCHLPYPWRFIDNACFNQVSSTLLTCGLHLSTKSLMRSRLFFGTSSRLSTVSSTLLSYSYRCLLSGEFRLERARRSSSLHALQSA